ncbi:hypothetical protein HDU98_008626 [Podochytrium sp. JEL0797]|nr:hypothetical protein HDU98_008626 [Podochytrium sp. JEL0797]
MEIESIQAPRLPPESATLAVLASGWTPPENNDGVWKPVAGDANAVDGVAIQAYEAGGLPGFVSLDVGDVVLVVEQHQTATQTTWFRGYVFAATFAAPLAAQHFALGVFPAAHVVLSVRPAGQGTLEAPMLSGVSLFAAHPRIPPPAFPTYETVLGFREPLIDGIAATLAEWADLLKTHLNAQDYAKHTAILALSRQLYHGRSQLLAGALSRDRLAKIRANLVDILEFGNHLQGLVAIVRHRSRGYLLGEKKTSSIVRVFASHFETHERLRLSDHSFSIYSKLYEKVSAHRYTLSLAPLDPDPRSLLNAPSLNRNDPVLTYYVHFELSSCFAQICLPGEHADLIFSLYDHRARRPLTEDFLVRIDYTGMPVSTDAEGRLRLKTVFCELGEGDFASDAASVCLVVRIVRVGRMNSNEKEVGGGVGLGDTESLFGKEGPFRLGFASRLGSGGGDLLSKRPSLRNRASTESLGSGSSSGDGVGLRRPFAAGVLDLTEIWNKARKAGVSDTNAVIESSVAAANVSENDVDRNLMEGAEHTLQLYSPVPESGFPDLPDQIIKQSDTNSSQENIKVVLNMSAHTCSVSEPVPVSLIKVESTPRLGFPERIHPHDSRNSIYLTLQSGEFASRPTTFAQRNVQVMVQVRTSDGVFVDHCISRGFNGKENTYESVVYYHSNSPTWSETIRIDLEPQILEKAHLLVLLRQCSSAQDTGERGLFAFAFLPLIRGDFTVIADDIHTLILYKYDKSIVQTADYLKWTTNCTGTPEITTTTPSTPTKTASPKLRDKITLRTALCSTLMTQSTGILNLLHWRTATLHFRVPVSRILAQFRTSVPPLEIVKFLHGILDALIGVLDSSDSAPSTAASPATLARYPGGGVGAGAGGDASPVSETELNKVVFESMIYVFGIILQPRFGAYEAALEAYVDKFLRSTACWSKILEAFVALLEAGGSGSSKCELLCESIKVWRFWVQIVVRSGLVHQKLSVAEGGVAEGNDGAGNSFRDGLCAMLGILKGFIALPFDNVTEAQVLVLRHLMELVPYLETVYGAFALIPMLVDFVDSVNTTKPILNTFKLAFVHCLIHSSVFNDQKSRLTLVHATKRWILGPLTADLSSDANSSKIAAFRLSLSITVELIDKLHRVRDRLAKDAARVDKTGTDVAARSDLLKACVDEISPLLEPLIRQYGVLVKLVKSLPAETGATLRRGSTAAGDRKSRTTSVSFLQSPLRNELAELAAVILSFIHFLPSSELSALLKIHLGGTSKENGIGDVYIVMQSLMRGDAFPDHWASANMMISKCVIKVLRVVNDRLKVQQGSVKGSVSAQTQLFLLDYLSIILQLLTSRSIATEYFKPQLARLAYRLEADVRGEAGELFRFAWMEVIMADTVDRGSISFVRSLFASFLELTMSPHHKLKYAAIELLFSIIEHECKTKGDFSSLEAECLDRLEGLIISDGKGDQVFRRFFVDSLSKYFTAAAVSSVAAATSKLDDEASRRTFSTSAASSNITSFAACGARFLKNVDTLMDMCITLRDIPSDPRFDEERIWMSLKLMYFFRDMSRRGLYVRYIHKLSELHSALGNTAESALSLKLHGDLLPWSHDEQLDPLPQYGFSTRQSAFERKEQIWLSCLAGLEQTNNWERAIVLYSELAAQYEKKWFNYTDYARILRKQADLVENITSKERYFPTYYRVGFYGNEHLSYLQGKQFIYKAREWEKLASFCESILNKFVGSQLLASNAPPTDDIVHGNGSWIQITSVNPEIDRQRWADGDINSAWYNWEYDSERFSDVDTLPHHTDLSSASARGDGGESAGASLSDVSRGKGDHSNNYIKYLIEPDLDPDTESVISKANVLLDSIPTPVKAFYSSNEINAFSYSRPFRRQHHQEDAVSISSGGVGGMMDSSTSSLTDLWTEKTLFLSADTFPCLSQRSQVIKSFTIQLSPIENAIIAVRTKSRQLCAFLRQFENPENNGGSGGGVEANVNSFTMALNGAIDAPVNGGIPMYRKAFLEDGAAGYSASQVKMLSWSIENQIELLHRCLDVHGRLIGSQMRPLHDSLVSVFFRNFEKELVKLGVEVVRPASSVTAALIQEDRGGGKTLLRSASSAFLALNSRKTFDSNTGSALSSVIDLALGSPSSLQAPPGQLTSMSSNASATGLSIGAKMRGLFNKDLA